ncbi:hypothetical protein Ndes2526B_g05082 [Nannochloris sp. 'desiccata']
MDTQSNLGALAMQQQQHSAPPGNLILRSTVLNMEPHQRPPLHNVSASGALPGTSIPPEMYQQLGIIMPDNIAITVGAGGGGLFDSNGALLPGLNYTQMESMLAMAGVPFSGQQLGEHLLEAQQQSGPISETARKEAAAAARAARQAKRREEKLKKQDRARKISNVTPADLQPMANTNVATAASMAALPPAVLQVGPALVPTVVVPDQPSTSQQPLRSSSKRERGRKTSNAAGNKSEQRAIKNRESAARSRAKRVEYTSALEAQIEQLRSQNKTLRTRVISSVAAPPDPHAGKVDGRPLRRTRTMPL